MYSVLDFGECSYPARCEFPSSGHPPNGLKTKRSPLFEKRNATLLHGSLLLHMAIRVHLTLSDEVGCLLTNLLTSSDCFRLKKDL